MRSYSDQDDVTIDAPELVDAELLSKLQQIHERLLDGKQPNLDDLITKKPEHAEALMRYVRTMRVITDYGASTDSRGTDSSDKQTRIGEFTIVREIGRGGMGVVYEAVQETLDRQVALKVLPFAAVANERAIQRFRNEARAAATLHHKNIVPVHSVGADKGIHYFAMQLINGPSLATVIGELQELPATRSVVDDPDSASRALPPTSRTKDVTETHRRLQAAISTQRQGSKIKYFRDAANWIAQAADGLAHAHENGVLHRDVKPGNLLLDENGTVWITDFGLARLESDASLTSTGDMLGTVRYMAPEQAAGKGELVDQRADIFGLGLTLYELLTLRPGYSAVTREQLLHQVHQGEVAGVRKLDSTIPSDLETIILKATARDTNDRYLTAKELAADLRAFLTSRPIAAKRPSVMNRVWKCAERHQLTVTTAAALLLVAVSAIGLSQYFANQRVQAAFIQVESKNRELLAAQKEKDKSLAMANEAITRFHQRFTHKFVPRLRSLPDMRDECDLFNKETLDYLRRLAELQPDDDVVQCQAASAICSYSFEYEFTAQAHQTAVAEAFRLVSKIDCEMLPLTAFNAYAHVLDRMIEYQQQSGTDNGDDHQRLLSQRLAVAEELTHRLINSVDFDLLLQLGHIQQNTGPGLDADTQRKWCAAAIISFQRAREVASSPDQRFQSTLWIARTLLQGPDWMSSSEIRERAKQTIDGALEEGLPENPDSFHVYLACEVLRLLAAFEPQHGKLELWSQILGLLESHPLAVQDAEANKYAHTAKGIFLLSGDLQRARAANQHQMMVLEHLTDDQVAHRHEILHHCQRFHAMLLGLDGRMDEAIDFLTHAPYGPTLDGKPLAPVWTSDMSAGWNMPDICAFYVIKPDLFYLTARPVVKPSNRVMQQRLRDLMFEFIERHPGEVPTTLTLLKFAWGDKATAADAHERLDHTLYGSEGNRASPDYDWRCLWPTLLSRELSAEQAANCREFVRIAEDAGPEAQASREWNMLLGWSYLRLEHVDKAISTFQRVPAPSEDRTFYSHVDPRAEQLCSKLGLVVANSRLGKHEAATAIFDEAVSDNVFVPSYWLSNGTIALLREAAEATRQMDRLSTFLADKTFVD